MDSRFDGSLLAGSWDRFEHPALDIFGAEVVTRLLLGASTVGAGSEERTPDGDAEEAYKPSLSTHRWNVLAWELVSVQRRNDWYCAVVDWYRRFWGAPSSAGIPRDPGQCGQRP